MNEPLVLLPPMMCDFRAFQPQLMGLSRECALHFPPLKNVDSIEAMAQSALEAAPEKFALAGFGLGGTVALEIARRAPGRLTRLALIDAHYMYETATIAAERDVQMARVRAGRLRDVMREDILAHFPQDQQPSNEYLEFVLAMATDLGPDYYQNQARALQRRPDQQGTLRRMRGFKTMIMCSQLNQQTQIKRHKFAANLIEDASIEIIPNSAYIASAEQPRAVNAALMTWMQQA